MFLFLDVCWIGSIWRPVLHSLLRSKALPAQTGFQMHLSLAKTTAFIY